MVLSSSFLWSQLQSLALRGTVILAAAALGTQLLRHASAAARHLVWLLALLALLATPVLSAVLPPWELTLPAAATRELVPDLYLGHAPGTPPASADRQAPTLTARLRALPSAALYLGRADPASGKLSATTLCAVFIGGLLFCLARLGLGWLAIRRLLARSQPVTDRSWTDLLQSLSRELALHRPVRLLGTAGRHTPLCTGLRRPAIVLPADAAGWSAQRRRVILLHELAHIRRRDCLTGNSAPGSHRSVLR